MDQGIEPILVPKRVGMFATGAEQWRNTFRGETFFVAVCMEFREQTMHWPVITILWHYGALLILLASIAAGLVAVAKGAWLVMILSALGLLAYVRMYIRENAVLVAEWKRYRAANAGIVSS